jgi:hypothetical protein
MVLGDVEETVTTQEVDEETYEEIIRVLTQPPTSIPTTVLTQMHPILFPTDVETDDRNALRSRRCCHSGS